MSLMQRPWGRSNLLSLLFGLAVLLAGCIAPLNPRGPTITSSPDLPGALSPTAQAVPTPTAISSTILSPVARPVIQVPVPPDADLFDLAARLKLKGQTPPAVVNPNPVSLTEGLRRSFWLIDLDNIKPFEAKAVLRHVTPNLYMWFEEDSSTRAEDIEVSARKIEEIYAKLTEIFGTESAAGVDNDPHLYIIHARMPLVAGYYSSADQYPKAIHEFSNEAEIIYINLGALKPNTQQYFSVIAHELQHAIHWRADPSEEAWVNEGLSELATELAGFSVGLLRSFYENSDTQLTTWPDGPRESAPYYGASYLFMKYLVENYGGPQRLRDLIHEPADGIDGIERWLARGGYAQKIEEVFANWVIANFQGKGKPPLAYMDLRGSMMDLQPIAREGERKGTVRPFAADYFDIRLEGDVAIEFQGEPWSKLIPNEAFSGKFQWWSNRGDSIDSTLTREFDLTGTQKATLRYHLWFDNEKDWDYTYVVASTDGGKRWDVLQGQHTSSANPVGNNFGHGYTGKSGEDAGPRWIEDEVDLSPYTGAKVLVRFEHVTDGAVNNNGFALDDISLPELGYFADFEADGGGWQAQGFVRIDNTIPQPFLVQVLEMDGGVRVDKIVLDSGQRGSLVLRGLGSRINRAIVIVSALTRFTTQPATYSLKVQRLNSG